MKYLTPGQVAKDARVNIETLRYYERRGLLPEPRRRPSGYRQYAPDIVSRIRCIKRAQELGFSLEDIKELLSLKPDTDTPAIKLRRRAETTLSSINGKLADLQRMKRALERFIRQCDGEKTVQPCFLVEAFHDDGWPGDEGV